MCEQGSKLKQIRLAHTTKSLKTHALVDPCIARIIQMFNDNGYQTVASCCGHGVRPGVITLENGTELILCYSYKQTRMVEALYPGLHEDIAVNPPPMNVDDYEKLVNELEEANAVLVTKKFIDHEKMENQWEGMKGIERENKELESDRDALVSDRDNLKTRISELVKELKLQEQDNERITQASKAAVETMRTDRDGQKAGWDASAKVSDKLVVELNNQRNENETLKVTISSLRTASIFKKEYDPS